MTLWNSLKFQGCKIWDHFNFCRDMVKRSRILQLQNMEPFQFLSWHGKMVSNFVAAKYETVSILSWCAKNSLKFCSCKIWDRFNFWPGVVRQSQISQPQNIGLFQLSSWHGKMVSNFATKWSQISLLQNLRPFWFLMGKIWFLSSHAWKGLKFCGCKIQGKKLILLTLSEVPNETKIIFKFLTFLCLWH